MTPQELLRKIRRIQIRTSHMASDVFAGHYHSAFKGQGMEFEEVREYQPGDDIRNIDWNVTARHSRPFIKRFREEREQTVMLLVDASASQAFGTQGPLKRDIVTEIGATLAFSAITNNDKVGLVIFSDRIEKHVQPAKGTRHVLRVIRELLTSKPAGHGTDIAGALEHLNHVLRRRAVVFIVSDFKSPDYEPQLRIARRRHDIIPIVVSDPGEQSLPPMGIVDWIDNETGIRQTIDTSSRRFRDTYAKHVAAERLRVEGVFKRLKADGIELTTSESIVEPLTRYFRRREARIRSGR
ncbi:MAG: DUF58 domain-containing protein [Phycisphaerales bacterium]|nr:DUF58 domain-containing protein [Phycisphaerales bacterium]MCB9862358.1 DUF58 domain-containing protein [Phycisphaerales bacterium]